MENVQTQRALLVGVDLQSQHQGWSATESLMELGRLAETAGATVVGHEVQRRQSPDPATFIGPGKVEELAHRHQAEGFDLVIFDDELSPVQQRNLSEALACAVIDRTALILDIFAMRAQSKEAKLQVELAQQEYLLPRLVGLGTVLSRLGGGIGTRGPGETKLEVDRRTIRDRIAALKRELATVSAHRQRLRERRRGKPTPVVALVGYTNAGKSTLHRALASSEVLAEDRLFATLDAVGRRVEPAEGEPYVLVDTVGFIQKLPHKLVAAFRSTLEEVLEADLLLHVVDASHPKCEAQMATVGSVLTDLGAAKQPQLLVFNKADAAEGPGALKRLQTAHPASVVVSALKGQGLGQLGQAIQGALAQRRRRLELLIPYGHAALLAQVHDQGVVIFEEHQAEGTYVIAELEQGLAARLLAQLGKGD